MSKAFDFSTRKPGKVIQVKHVQTSPTIYAITAQDISNIPGLSISFTPKRADSIIVLTAMVNHNGRWVATIGFLKNGSPVISNTNTNSNGSVSTVYDGLDIDGYMYNSNVMAHEISGSKTARTYTVGICASYNGSLRTLYVNDRGDQEMRSISSFTIYEISP